MNSLTIKLLLAFVCFPQFIIASEGSGSSPAKLIVTKTILNSYIVKGKEFTLDYYIQNIAGETSARQIELHDSVNNDFFELVIGSPNVKWPIILPKSSISHSLILIPSFTGYYNMTQGYLTYNNGVDSEPISAFTSNPGTIGVADTKQYNRQFSPYRLEWICFAIILTPCLLIPYLLWLSSSKNYVN